jgi:hypothetical protein
LTGQPDAGAASPSPARGIAGLIVANLSLLIAILVYMGWAYEDALYGYFHVRPLDLDVGIAEYILRSLSLFSTSLVFAAALLIVVTAVRTWGLDTTKTATIINHQLAAHLPGAARLRRPTPATGSAEARIGRIVQIGTGAAMTVTAAVLAWIDTAGYFDPSTYLVLILLGGGLFIMTRPTRADRRGRFPYALAIVVAAVCGLWAASLYANAVGTGAAESLVRGLPTRTGVVVYSTQPLALSGPGVTERPLSKQYLYHYRYQGLRLLITRSGTYYLLPIGWSQRPDDDVTYVIDDNDQIRIELY